MTRRLPTTQAMAGIYHGQQLDPGHAGYWTAECVEIRGDIDRRRLADAINATVRQAESLHTNYPDAHTQHIEVDNHWECEVVTLDHGDWAHIAAVVQPRLDSAADLGRDALFQSTLYCAPDRVFWYIQAHHIVLDGFGYALLYRQVCQRYAGGKIREFGSLDALTNDDEAYAGSEKASQSRDWWRQRLDGVVTRSFSSATALPGRAPRHRAIEVDATTAASWSRNWPHRVIAAVAAALHRHTGTEQPVLGLPVSGRLGGPAATIPGMVMNIAPLPIPVRTGDTMEELTSRVTNELRRVRPHQRYRHERLREDLAARPGQRLFGPVVNIIPFAATPEFADCEVISHYVAAGPVDDVAITARHSTDITIEANAALYSATDVADIAEAISALLRDEGRVSPWHLLPYQEAPEPTPVLESLALHAREQPQRIAIMDNETQISYMELQEATARVSAGLATQGVGPGDVVAVSLARGARAITAMLGVLHSGAAYLPLPPDGPPQRNAAILAEAQPAAIIEGDALPDAPATFAPRGQDDDTAYIMYTSGSTGHPKGVAISRAALHFFTATATRRYAITAQDRVLQFAPLHFDTHVEEIFVTLAAGARIVVRDDSATTSFPRFQRFLTDHAITVLDLPTAYWHELTLAIHHGQLTLPPSVTTVIIGGEAADAQRVAQWHEAVNPEIRLINTYGPTEATVVCLAADLTPESPVRLGTPLAGVRAAVGPGEELYVAGPGLASRYLGDTTDVEFSIVDGVRWYRTGDVVRLLADDEVDYVGRGDDQLKISGHRVIPTEIEAALMRHEAVSEVAVVADRTTGGVRLVAYVVAGTAERADLTAHARRLLPAVAVPGHFVFTARLPRTPSGKIDRRRLFTDTPSGTSAPGNALEAKIAEVFGEVLGVAVDTMDTDFFAAGGGSLGAIAVARRLSTVFGRDVTAAELFARPTVAGLAAALDGQNPDEDITAAIAADTRWYPPVPAETRGDGAVVLTGASGFVGTHVLAELLATTDVTVRCLIRGGRARLDEVAARYRLPRPDPDRVDVIAADLARSDLGIVGAASTRVAGSAAILNCAADVNFSRGYHGLRSVNVDAVKALLEYGLEFHQVSTVSVGAGGPLPEDFVSARDLRDGYQATKWVAEDLVRQAAEGGLGTSCYRLGRIVPPPGASYRNSSDLMSLLLDAAIHVGALPDLALTEPWMSADVTASCLARLVTQSRTGVWNLVPPEPVALRRVWHAAQRHQPELRIVSPREWMDLLERAPGADPTGVLRAFLALRTEFTAQPPPVDTRRFQDWTITEGMGSVSPPVGRIVSALLPTDKDSAAILPS